MTVLQKASVFLASGFILLLGSLYQNCSGYNFTINGGNASPSENATLQTPAFDVNSQVAGVVSGDGNPSENLRFATEEKVSQNWVQDCTDVPNYKNSGMSRSLYERNQALNAAATDPNKTTIPVQFAISFGTLNDTLALWAHQRAIISDNGTSESFIPSGTSYIPVGDRTGGQYTAPNGGGQQAYYEVSHQTALNDYRWGKNCFYDTVQIQGSMKTSDSSWARDGEYIYPFISKNIPTSWTVTNIQNPSNVLHLIHYMYFGYCDPNLATACANSTDSAYGPGSYGDDMYPNRLFGAWGTAATTLVDNLHVAQDGGLPRPQIVKLYVADLRESQLGLGADILPNTNVNRGQETSLDIKKLNGGLEALRLLWQKRPEAIVNLSTEFVAGKDPLAPADGPVLKFAGLVGVPQFLSNLILSGGEGTLLAAQYTPIVLDLGSSGVMTSSPFGGTYFNMAGAFDNNVTGPDAYFQPHETAWVGGKLVDLGAPNSSYQHQWARVAEDGFLVITDPDGKVRSSRNLLGTQTRVNDKTFANGFLALQALGSKNCASKDLTEQYIGPWDGALYQSTLKVWVDANRNGIVDAGEIKSLHDLGIVAINACNVRNHQEADAFGNGTTMRSAFLYQDLNQEDITNNTTEIVNRLTTGLTASGATATFRLAIDLVFQSVPSNNLWTKTTTVPNMINDAALVRTQSVNQNQSN